MGAIGTTNGTAERIVDAAMALLVRGGRDAVSTRAVCAAAGCRHGADPHRHPRGRARPDPVPPARESGLVSAAVSLRALLDRATALTAGEQVLLAEWLDRIARHDG